MINQIRLFRTVRFLVALSLCLFVTPGTILAQVPQKEYAQNYHEPFKGQPKQAEDFVLLGADAGKYVQFEPDGLRITLPAGKSRGPIGVATAFGVMGDFEITVRYEILEEPEPADAGTPNIGTRISLTVYLNRPQNNDASMRRKVTPTQKPHILTFRSLRKEGDAKADTLGATFPVKEKTGRFRLVRTGADIAYYLSEGLDKEFTLLTTHRFGADDLKNVQIFGHTSSPKAALDARFTDLHISAASLPLKPAESKVEKSSEPPVPPKIDKVSEPKVPTKDYAQTYIQSFKGNRAAPPGWELFGKDAEQRVRFEPEGLRITLPLGQPLDRRGTGVVSHLTIEGDFEITMRFEILQEPLPKDAGSETRVNVEVSLDNPRGWTQAYVSRRVGPKGTAFTAWQVVPAENPPSNQKHNWYASDTGALTGRLRLTRTGSQLSYYSAEGSQGEFTLLKQYLFEKENVREVRIVASPGGPQGSYDVRVTDLRIRADAIPAAPASNAAAEAQPLQPVATPPLEGGRRWLVALLLIGLGITLVLSIALVIWFVRRKRHGPAQEVPPDATRPFISFACPKCAKALKVQAEMAGKRVKCARCGTAVLVPSIQAGETE